MTQAVVLVTGGTRGLGLAIAEKLAESDYRIVVCGRTRTDALERVADRHSNVVYERFDVSETAEIPGFLADLKRQYGALYGLVNNAAVGLDGILATFHDSEIRQLLTVNLESAILMAKYASRSMLREQSGRIVNISSIIAHTGFRGLSVYAATKAALEGFSRSLARELGPVGITVNCVAPGYMETGMTKGLKAEDVASIVRRSPMGSLVTPGDVANCVHYLLSPQASAITGTVLTVDAGSSA